MSTEEKLPLDLTWQANGHATEVALSMIADGELALLPEGVEGHVEGCDACSQRLGAAALLSLRATEELPAVAARMALAEARTELAVVAPRRALQGSPFMAPVRMPMARPRTKPIPARAIAAALLVAVVGAIPSFVLGLPKIPDVMTSVLRTLPVLGRSMVALFQWIASDRGWVAPALTWLAALLFLLVGLSLARSMSRARSIQGGVG